MKRAVSDEKRPSTLRSELREIKKVVGASLKDSLLSVAKCRAILASDTKLSEVMVFYPVTKAAFRSLVGVEFTEHDCVRLDKPTLIQALGISKVERGGARNERYNACAATFSWTLKAAEDIGELNMQYEVERAVSKQDGTATDTATKTERSEHDGEAAQGQLNTPCTSSSGGLSL